MLLAGTSSVYPLYTIKCAEKAVQCTTTSPEFLLSQKEYRCGDEIALTLLPKFGVHDQNVTTCVPSVIGVL